MYQILDHQIGFWVTHQSLKYYTTVHFHEVFGRFLVLGQGKLVILGFIYFIYFNILHNYVDDVNLLLTGFHYW